MTLSLVLLFLFLSAPEVFLTPRHCNNIRYNNNDNNSNVAAVAAVKKDCWPVVVRCTDPSLSVILFMSLYHKDSLENCG